MSDPLTLFALVGGTLAGAGALVKLRRSRHAPVDPPAPRGVYPRFDLDRCIRSGACTTACPEGDVISIVDGVPVLVDATACVGHADCLRACAVGAIQLVLGSPAHGVEVPSVSAGLETNLEGVYVAGELGGIGLVHNAVAQGIAVIDTISSAARPRTGAFDVIIVGAGPAGLAAALRARERGLAFVVLDKTTLGGAIRSFPRQKMVMTTPFHLPLHGHVRRREISKEDLLALWTGLGDRHHLPIREGCEMIGLRRSSDGYEVVCSQETLTTTTLVLAIGRRGTPRRLDIPGETAPNVTYELLEPDQYIGRACVIVGGGDSAVEAALTLAAVEGTRVALIHRRDAVSAKPRNQERLRAAEAANRITFHRSATPLAIEATCLRTRTKDGIDVEVPADFTFVMVGGELPSPWLRSLGITLETVRGRPVGVNQ
jgi:thioredoxin reductase (NADPH)